jgi:hypothetical protein
MSGGGLNRIQSYTLAGDDGRREDIADAAELLDKLGHTDTWAARDTRRVLALIDEARALMAGLEPVWAMLDGHASLDYGPHQVAEAIADGPVKP